MISPSLEWDLPEPVADPPSFDGFGAPVATLLARRGFTDAASLARFLEPDDGALHPVSLMADSEAALERIGQAIERGERIAIWGDYDADGMSAIAVWIVALRELGVEAERYIPSRWAEGYGLSEAGLRTLADRGIGLVVTCDCGVSNVAEVDAARQLGLDVIVTDHHLPPAVLPRAIAVVDPHRPDCAYPDADLTGAGVAFRLATELLARRGVHAQDLAGLAAIGTVADVAPMTGESRTIVQLGLRELAETRRAGLRALMVRSVGESARPTARDLAFAIAPRINAAGRIADADLAIALLVEDDPASAAPLADALEAVHHRRRELTATAVEEARKLVTGAIAVGAAGPLVLRNDAWEPGLLGLVAGRLVETLSRPVVAASRVDDEVRGSVRAPADFHVAAALEACADHLLKRGGHAAAGGFSAAPDAWEAFAAAFRALGRPFPLDRDAGSERPGFLPIDLVLPARHLGWNLVRDIERLAPFGPGHPEPVLAVTGLRVAEARRVGRDEAHILFRMRRGAEAFDAVAFGASGRELPEPGAAIDLAGTLERDSFQGVDRLRLRVIDFADSGSSPLQARRLAHRTPQVAAAR